MIHGELPTGPADVWNHWPVRPSVVLPVLLSACAYTFGVDRLWQKAGVGRQISRVRASAFMVGTIVLLLALATPLDPLGEVLFSAHMIQHLLLILVAAPLLVAGAPEVAFLWALPPRGRKAVGGWVARAERALDTDERNALVSLAAVVIATGVLWAWHVPVLYDLAVENEWVHATEHAGFLLTAVLFWATILRLAPRSQLRNGVRVLLVFAMAVQGSVLGALITFARRPLYEAHAAIDPVWRITPLADQELAGLIMWVPPALLYIAVTAYLFVRWLEAVEERSRARERRQAAQSGAKATSAASGGGGSPRGGPAASGALPALLTGVLVLTGCGDDNGGRTGDPEDGVAAEGAGVESVADGFTEAPVDTPITMAAGQLQSPETALWDSIHDVYLVSSINGGLTDTDDNGFISRIRPNGEVAALHWVYGKDNPDVTLHGPKGMVFRDENTIAVADIQTVRFYDRSTGAPTGQVEIPEAYMLNDLAVMPDGTLYVTDTGDSGGQHPGAIYRIERGTATAVAQGDHLERPDGIIPFEGGRLLLTPFATHANHVYSLDPDGRRVQYVRMPEPQLDGLLRLPDGSLLVTSWGGNAVYRVRGRDIERFAGGIPTPAQVGFDLRRGRVLIPVLQQNKLLVYELEPGADPAPQ